MQSLALFVGNYGAFILTDYYHLLNIPLNADRKAIKQAYRHLALQYHPDVRPNDQFAENHFKEISIAYRTLINPVRRAQYDHSLGNITNNTKIYPSDSMMNDPVTNFMLRIIFLGFGITLLIIAIQIGFIVHYSDKSNVEVSSNFTPKLERFTLTDSQQQTIFNPALYPTAPTCIYTIEANTQSCHHEDLHLQVTTTNHQTLITTNFPSLDQYSGILFIINYAKIPEETTLLISNPDSDSAEIQIINQTLKILGETETLVEIPEAIEEQTTFYLNIEPSTLYWKINDYAEAIQSSNLFPLFPSTKDSSLLVTINHNPQNNHQTGSDITSIQILLLPPEDIR